VPEDISVIGYDDIELAPYFGLTSVHQPLFESGQLGADLLMALLRQEEVEDVSLAVSVVERDTVARL
ncbi:MAG: substrate-binding domain-containing protein, partial [Acidimicrobiia bacterium]|nr:substrate-binding domain-containing protein [Acidimicrobiia bacterium]